MLLLYFPVPVATAVRLKITTKRPSAAFLFRACNTVLLVLLAWQLARLFWLLAAPPALPDKPLPQAAAPAALRDISALLAANLFGVAGGGQAATGDSSNLPATSLSFKLRGIIAGSDKQPGAALFSGIEAKEKAVAVGQTIQPGVMLQAAHAAYIVLNNNGRLERLDLDAKPALEIPTGQAALDAARQLRSTTSDLAPSPVAPVAGPAPGGARVSRGQLAQAMQGGNVAEWARGLANAPSGGILVENTATQPLARTLNLQNGDVIKSVNGVPLSRTADISTLYGIFSQQPEARLEVFRNGSPMQLHYQIQP